MCGICGYVSNEKHEKEDRIKDMFEIQLNGCSNSVNSYIKENVVLGCAKLNGKDTDFESHPMSKICNNTKYTIICSGELYNSEEIKQDLEKKGYIFETNCDMEIILCAYMCYKQRCLNLFNGAYAFVIVEEETNKVFFARDRLGIKPLFYYHKDETLVFASEIKSILKYPEVKAVIGKEQICEMFGLGPAHTLGKTFFKDIMEILPGHWAIYSNNDLKMVKYWDLETNTGKQEDINKVIDKVNFLVTDSLKRQLVSSMPVCTMLSGGLDSSILTYLASQEIDNLATFSIDFNNSTENFKGNDYQPTRDADYVKVMVELLKTNHTNLYFDNNDLFEGLREAMIARDMPGMADIDSSMLEFCKKIKEKGYQVAISGECSDEIFGGYPWYYRPHLLNSNTFPWSRSIKTRSLIVNKSIVSEEELFKYIEKAYNDTVKSVVYNSEDPMENEFRKTCYLTVKWFMNTLVERASRISAAVGMKIRVPFADYRIFEYLYNVSARYKLGLIGVRKEPVEKYILRKAFEKQLPKEIVYRKKSPFPKTYDPKYLEMLEDKIKDLINSSTAPVLEIIDVKYLYELLETHGENLKENWFGQLMTYPQTLAYLIQINMWLLEYDIEIEA